MNTILKKLIPSSLLILSFFIAILVIAQVITSRSDDSVPAPTMYTLKDVYNLIHNIGTTTEGVHSLTPATSSSESHFPSVSQIYADLANLIRRENIKTGATYLGVIGNFNTSDPDRSTTTIIYPSLAPTTILPQATGYTLEDIYNLVTANTIAVAGGHPFLPRNSPVSSMHTISDIYKALEVLIDPTKVRIGVTYLGKKGSYDPDITPPIITAFSIPSTSASTTVNITTFTATDDIAVTGYKLTEVLLAPLPNNPGWSSVVPTTYTFSSSSPKTLYAWAKDAAGNVSAPQSSVIIFTIPALVITGGSLVPDVTGNYYESGRRNGHSEYTNFTKRYVIVNLGNWWISDPWAGGLWTNPEGKILGAYVPGSIGGSGTPIVSLP